MIGLLNQRIDEYTSTTTINQDTGIKAETYTHHKSYQGRLEAITREKAERVFGLHDDVEYRLFSLAEPTLGGYIKAGEEYLRILRCLPMQGMNGVHHYEAAIG